MPDPNDVVTPEVGTETSTGTEEKVGGLLTKDLGGTDGGKPEGTDGQTPDEAAEGAKATEQKPEEQDPATMVPETADGYVLTFGEETQVDGALLGKFTETALELGLSQGQAQKLGSLFEAHTMETQKQQMQAMKQAVDDWEDQIQARPDFVREKEHAQKCLRMYGTDELKGLLEDTLLASHPEFFAFLAKVGAKLPEPGMVGNSATGEAKSHANILYPDMK